MRYGEGEKKRTRGGRQRRVFTVELGGNMLPSVPVGEPAGLHLEAWARRQTRSGSETCVRESSAAVQDKWGDA